jgi:hypothetical protein
LFLGALLRQKFSNGLDGFFPFLLDNLHHACFTFAMVPHFKPLAVAAGESIFVALTGVSAAFPPKIHIFAQFVGMNAFAYELYGADDIVKSILKQSHGLANQTMRLRQFIIIGGSASGGNVANIPGGGGSGHGKNPASGTAGVTGGHGGNSYFGGGGGGAIPDVAGGIGGDAVTNSGSGGGGGGSNTNSRSGAGGAAGGYVEHIISSPAATYSYAVGPGSAGAAGTSAGNGGAGADGQIIVEEYYN